MKTKFKSKYVLGVGYPWTKGYIQAPYEGWLAMSNKKQDTDPIDIEMPEELYSDECPRFRLVLERIWEKK